MKRNIINSYVMKMMMALLLAGIATAVVEYLLIIAMEMHMNFAPDGSLVLDDGMSLEMKVAIIVIWGIMIFYGCMLYVFRNHIRQMHHILDGIETMATGDLDTKISLDSAGELSGLANSLNHMADQLRKLIEEERQREQMKNTLITNVAHDLRTPLTSTLGFLQLLREYPDMSLSDRVHFTEIAYNKAARLEAMVEDLFTYTKFQQSDYQMNLEKLDAVKLLEQLLDEFSLILEEEQMEYELVLRTPALPLMADGKLLARLFENLIQNAIKYGKSGKRLTICISETEEKACISVTNYGEMIPKEELDFIFERFYRLEYSRNSCTGGNGLGLAIAQSIARLHGGKISAFSTPQETTFQVVLLKNGKKHIL